MSEAIDEQESKVWVRTEPTVDGSTYVVTLEVNRDSAVVLTPERAMAYCGELMRVCARVSYEAAVVLQLKKLLDDNMRLVGQVVNDMRQDRPPINDELTSPLVFGGGVSAQTGDPFITLAFEDDPKKVVGQWSVEAAEGHVLIVLHAVEAANLDAEYHRILVGVVGTDDAIARNVIDDLQKWRPER